jgi:cell division septation protein DedD
LHQLAALSQTLIGLSKMDIKLTTDIKNLLIEDGSICIPDFGGFTSAYKPAVVDAMNGQLAPPSFHIAFDANLQMNDGRLVDFIRQKYRLSSTAAMEYIEAFAADARANFDKGEIVVLPEIGRLYRDFAQKIQFLPDATNFNTESFGLPSIQYTPVLRNKIESINRATADDAVPLPESSAPVLATTPTPQIEPPTPSISAPKPTREDVKPASLEQITPPAASQPQAAAMEAPISVETLAGRNAPIFPSTMDAVKPPTWSKVDDVMEKVRENWRTWVPIAAVMTIMGVLVWQLNDASKIKNTEGSKKARAAEPNVNTSPLQSGASESNVNVAPPANESLIAQVPDNQTDRTTITSPDVLSETHKNETPMSRQPNLTPSAKTRRATILIGGFGNQGNIQKLKAWISGKGYGIYERKSGGLTLIGCEVPYQSRAELQRIMNQLRSKYGDEIELLKK